MYVYTHMQRMCPIIHCLIQKNFPLFQSLIKPCASQQMRRLCQGETGRNKIILTYDVQKNVLKYVFKGSVN